LLTRSRVARRIARRRTTGAGAMANGIAAGHVPVQIGAASARSVGRETFAGFALGRNWSACPVGTDLAVREHGAVQVALASSRIRRRNAFAVQKVDSARTVVGEAARLCVRRGYRTGTWIAGRAAAAWEGAGALAADALDARTRARPVRTDLTRS